MPGLSSHVVSRLTCRASRSWRRLPTSWRSSRQEAPSGSGTRRAETPTITGRNLNRSRSRSVKLLHGGNVLRELSFHTTETEHFYSRLQLHTLKSRQDSGYKSLDTPINYHDLPFINWWLSSAVSVKNIRAADPGSDGMSVLVVGVSPNIIRGGSKWNWRRL